MLGPVEEKRLRATISTSRYIYLAFVTAILMYTLVAYSVTATSTHKTSGFDTLRRVFIGLSLAAVVGKFWAQIRQTDERSYAKCINMELSMKKYTTYFFISMAMAEIPALCGLIMVFVTMRMGEWWMFVGISGVLLATSMPRYEVLEKIVMARLARNPAEAEELAVEPPPEISKDVLDDAGDFDIPPLLIRIAAFLIDLTPMVVICHFVLSLPAFGMSMGLENSILAGLIAYTIYQAVLIYSLGRTIGCIVTGLKIIPSDGFRFGFGKLLARGLVMSLMIVLLFPAFLIIEGAIMIWGIRKGTNQYKRAGWDYVGRTLVIHPR